MSWEREWSVPAIFVKRFEGRNYAPMLAAFTNPKPGQWIVWEGEMPNVEPLLDGDFSYVAGMVSEDA